MKTFAVSDGTLNFEFSRECLVRNSAATGTKRGFAPGVKAVREVVVVAVN